MSKIHRKQIREGIEIPGILYNTSYHFKRIAIYEDGIIGCGHMCDLKGLREDLRIKRVLPSIPDGRALYIFGIGAYEIEDANWKYDEESFYVHVEETLRSINPELENTFELTEREEMRWRRRGISFANIPEPFRLRGSYGYDLFDGDSRNTFYRDEDGKLYLSALTVYGDKSFQIEHLGEKLFQLDDILSMIEDRRLYATPAVGERLFIEDLGDMSLRLSMEEIGPKERMKEVSQWCRRVAGEGDVYRDCLQAYHEYLVNPSEWNRRRLKDAYEAVPEYERMYLGDMETRDYDFQRIIYHPENKREV